MPSINLVILKRCRERIRRGAQIIGEHLRRSASIGWNRIREGRLRKRVAGLRATPSAEAAGNTARRGFLRALSGLPFLGLFSWSSLKGNAAEKVDGISGPTVTLIERADMAEYFWLKNLDLNAPEVVASQKLMPVGKIGNLTLGRLISGSNLISINMHARDLDYVGELARHYNTEERIFMTLKKCEELGVNAIVLKNHNFRQFRLSNYWKEWGGKMQWIADVITTDINSYERLLVEHLELGAAAAYLWGGASDIWHSQQKQDNIIKAFEIMRKYKMPAGICAHQLAPIMFCEKEGLSPDFYMKTLHHDRYWSAHPKANRRFLEMFEAESPDHDFYHDNMFCHQHEETVAFMQSVKVPWIAFKVLAAGAIPPADGFQYAFQSGADFICVGMFDWQVKADAELARKCATETGNRHRAWF